MLNVPRWRLIAVLLASIWGLVYSAPNFLPHSYQRFLPGRSVNLGLDLQGGSHLLLEVKAEELFQEKLEGVAEEMAAALRDAKPRIGYTGRGVVGDAARVKVINPEDHARALNEARTVAQMVGAGAMGGSPNVQFVLTPDGAIEARLTDAGKDAMLRDAVERSIEVVRRRVDETGTKEISITRQGLDRIVVQAPGLQDPQELKRMVGQTAKMTFHLVVPAAESEGLTPFGPAPPGTEWLPPDDPEDGPVLVRKHAVLTGDNLVDASSGFIEQSNEPIINFVFDGAGRRIFCNLTTQHRGERFAAVLDGKVITAPTMDEPICGGRGYIHGRLSTELASERAKLLRAGALPAPLEVIEQRTVGAELGQDAVNAGLAAGIVAAIAVLVFMVLAYGLFGLFACAALVLNFLLIMAAMSGVGAALTLPGIAGLILTLAIAVDANVLIYERMRDEEKLGRSAALSIDAGFSKAMVTILDANVTTILAALILFQFGAGPVKGFAWTLFIGTITSVFTAVIVTQIIIAAWFRAVRPKKLPI